jgi:hypothetical protein
MTVGGALEGRVVQSAHLRLCPSFAKIWLALDIVGPWRRQLLGGIVGKDVDGQDEVANSMCKVEYTR